MKCARKDNFSHLAAIKSPLRQDGVGLNLIIEEECFCTFMQRGIAEIQTLKFSVHGSCVVTDTHQRAEEMPVGTIERAAER